MPITYKSVAYGAVKSRIVPFPPVHNVTQGSYFSTISAAVTAASSGDTIEVSAGTYQEQVSISKPLTLRGPNYNKAGNDPTRVVEATIQIIPSFGNYAYALYINSNNVTVEGFNIDAPDSLITNGVPAAYPVIGIEKSNFTFRNNKMYGGENPLYFYRGTDVLGTNLLIEGNYIDCGPFVNDVYNRGIYLYNMQGTVQDNVIVNSCIGIQHSSFAKTTSESIIQRNTVSAALTGLYNNVHLNGSAPNTWRQNTVTVAPNDRQGLKLLAGGAGADTGANAPSWIAARTQYTGTQGTGAAATVNFINNFFDCSRVSGQVYNNVRWVGFGFSGTGTPGGVGAVTVINGNNNSITDWTQTVRNLNPVSPNLSNNWWGTTDQTAITSETAVVNSGGGTITFTPILTSGTDTQPSTPGFQP
jgi:hypothetical protein